MMQNSLRLGLCQGACECLLHNLVGNVGDRVLGMDTAKGSYDLLLRRQVFLGDDARLIGIEHIEPCQRVQLTGQFGFVEKILEDFLRFGFPDNGTQAITVSGVVPPSPTAGPLNALARRNKSYAC